MTNLLQDFLKKFTQEQLLQLVPTSVQVAPTPDQSSLETEPQSLGTHLALTESEHQGTVSFQSSSDLTIEEDHVSGRQKNKKRPAPESPPSSPLGTRKARKRAREQPDSEKVKKGVDGFTKSIDTHTLSSVWEGEGSILEEWQSASSLQAKDYRENQIISFMNRGGMLWARNESKRHEAECIRRILNLYFSHWTESYEGLPEILRQRSQGRAARSIAYKTISHATGMSVREISRVIGSCQKYFQLAMDAGLGHLLEMDATNGRM